MGNHVVETGETLSLDGASVQLAVNSQEVARVHAALRMCVLFVKQILHHVTAAGLWFRY